MRRVAAGRSHCNCLDGLDLRTGPQTGLTGNGIDIVELDRSLALETMCIGGRQALAAVIERV